MSSADSSFIASDFALRLPNTDRGKVWLAQFDADDRENAARLLSALTLVSHSAFERAVTALILTEAARVDGPVALYATRELNEDINYFEVMADPDDPMAPLDAVGGALMSAARCGPPRSSATSARPIPTNC